MKPSTIQNTIFNKICKLVLRSKIHYLTSYNERNIMNNSDFDILFSSNDSNDLSSSDKIVKYCRSKRISFLIINK